MNYTEAVNYIHSLLKFGIRPGLTRMDALLAFLGNPHKECKYVHVAGTNGKGSVSTAISNVLCESGLRVGLFTSPYVTDFLERIQFNGAPVERSVFAENVSRVKTAVDSLNKDGVEITEFEALTAAAFLCFIAYECDVVVLEVGLGGRLDATNVIDTPLVNVITSLSLDHVAILGNTVEKIAFEKCGTLKNGGRAVCSYGQPDGAMNVIKNICAERNNTLTVPDKAEIRVLSSDIFGTRFEYKTNEYFVKMAGAHQLKNMTAVIEACEILKQYFGITDENIKRGISKTVLPARVEVMLTTPLVILDGGHNADGAAAFFAALEPALDGRGKLIAVAGMMADKAVETSLTPLMKRCDVFYAVTPDNPRAMKASELAELAGKYCDEVYCVDSPCEAVKAAFPALKENDTLCVVGSLYLAGEVRGELLKICNNY